MNPLSSVALFAEAEAAALDPTERARLLMALTGLALAGVLVLLFVVFGAWTLRRIVRRRRASPSKYAGSVTPVESLAALVDAHRSPAEAGYTQEDAKLAREANFSPADRRDLIRLRSNEPGLGPADPR